MTGTNVLRRLATMLLAGPLLAGPLLAGGALCANDAAAAPRGASDTATYDTVHFPSLDDQRTVLDGYLFRPEGAGRHPAVVFLHGCGGVLNRTGSINSRETDWAGRFNAAGYVVLMVNSLVPRHHGEMCSVKGFDLALYHARPKDAYGALAWLQAQDFVRGDRIGAMGWSEGGGTVLNALGTPSLGRPSDLPRERDFRVAVAMYPASCSGTKQPAGWTITIPLLVLIGAEDVWTPAAPCQRFLSAVAERGAPVQAQVYPGAYHDFDWPGETVRNRPEYTTRAGVVPITGMDPAARADSVQRVPAFLAQYLGN